MPNGKPAGGLSARRFTILQLYVLRPARGLFPLFLP